MILIWGLGCRASRESGKISATSLGFRVQA